MDLSRAGHGPFGLLEMSTQNGLKSSKLIIAQCTLTFAVTITAKPLLVLFYLADAVSAGSCFGKLGAGIDLGPMLFY